MITQLATASPAQRKVLHTLTDIGREATVVEIADRLGIHKNSVRETLVPLVEQGLVVRRTHNPEGRGRPAMYYEISSALPVRLMPPVMTRKPCFRFFEFSFQRAVSVR